MYTCPRTPPTASNTSRKMNRFLVMYVVELPNTQLRITATTKAAMTETQTPSVEKAGLPSWPAIALDGPWALRWGHVRDWLLSS
jgi:hypothetical protein